MKGNEKVNKKIVEPMLCGINHNSYNFWQYPGRG